MQNTFPIDRHCDNLNSSRYCLLWYNARFKIEHAEVRNRYLGLDAGGKPSREALEIKPRQSLYFSSTSEDVRNAVNIGPRSKSNHYLSFSFDAPSLA